MLIRFIVNNIFSFGELREFNMLPNARLRTLAHHKYNINGLELLKITSVYGANAAGKSNIIKALSLLDDFVRDEITIATIRNNHFKFSKNENEKQLLAIEFFQNNTSFYYSLEISRNIISCESLHISGLGKHEDQLLYRRETDTNKKTSILFHDAFEKDEKSQILKQILIEEFIKPDKPIFALLSKRDNIHLLDIKIAYEWFDYTLDIISPDSMASSLAVRIEREPTFKKYAEDIMSSFDLGVTSITFDKKEIRDFFGQENEKEANEIIEQVENASDKRISMKNDYGDRIIVIKENDNYFVKELKLEHSGSNNQIGLELNEESDGTRRLLDFIPAFHNLFTKAKVYVVDEIERSIHPLIIKELIKRFSQDPHTKGQLVFTTHESNLLDQDLFRQDEIWFAEKDKKGLTDLYSLSAFKEHKTIDIKKGYLNGRYGAIPFLANLQDLNWHKYDTE